MAQLDLRKKEIWLYDSSIVLYDDLNYFRKLLPLRVIISHWLARIDFYKTHEDKQPNRCWECKRFYDLPQQTPARGGCGVYMLMYMSYLMLGHIPNFIYCGDLLRKMIAMDEIL